MITIARKLWNDTDGFIVSAELVTVATVMVLGLIVGLNALQSTLLDEFKDVGAAFGALDQSYYFAGLRSSRGCCVKSATYGSAFYDYDRDQTNVALTDGRDDDWGHPRYSGHPPHPGLCDHLRGCAPRFEGFSPHMCEGCCPHADERSDGHAWDRSCPQSWEWSYPQHSCFRRPACGNPCMEPIPRPAPCCPHTFGSPCEAPLTVPVLPQPDPCECDEMQEHGQSQRKVG